ncbi:MAG: Gfo/Idh/MocA family protein [Halobacteriales archaeon]
MSGDQLRYGVIGCIGIGTTHGDAITAVEGADLMACADVVEENAEEFAESYGVEPYTDHVEMIEDADLDAVSICTPSGTHSDIAVSAAEAGANILCEKPLDVYLEDMNDMTDAAEENEVTLAGVFQRRTSPGAQRAKEAVEGGELGDMVLGDVQVKWYRTQEYYDSGGWRGTREMDGGVMMNQAVHGIDLLQWLMGGVERVHAKTDTMARDIEVEDVAVVTLEFENGAYGTIEASTIIQPQHPVTVELNGQEGSITLEDQEFTQFETADGEVEVEVPTHEWGEGHQAVVQDFVNALREGREPLVPAREARNAVEVILAAYASSARDEWVALDDLEDLPTY